MLALVGRLLVAAGTVLVCTRCGYEAHVPVPRLDPAGYTEACELFLARHRDYEAASS
jgi:hypothetical protein